MTEALASRVAGLKLGIIVGVLLVPMLVLSYFMVGALREDMDFSRRELLGVEMSRLIMPVAIGAANGKIDEKAIDVLRKQGAKLALELNVKPKFNTALATLLTFGPDKRFAVEALVALQRDVSTTSNIILDPRAETYYLGSIVSQHAPDLLSDFIELGTLTTRALRDNSISREESAQLLMGIGAWDESQWRVDTNLNLAASASAVPGDYSKMLAVMTEMREHPEHISSIFIKSEPGDLVQHLASAEEMGSSAGHVVTDIEGLWTFSTAAFEARIRERLLSMQIRLYGFLSIAAAACIIGVGGSALMFKSTLRRLDIVKLSRDQADAARQDAEQAAADVQRINEEVVRLNAGLARNIEMLRDAQDESVRKGKLAQLGQLTATVAHELRNPLGAVRTSAFLLERKVKGKGLGVEQQLDRINNGVTRCDNIISQLLDFARTKAIQPEMVMLDDWLAKIIEEEAQSLPAVVGIECDLTLGDAVVPFDPSRMRRALINLVGNAAEALAGKGDAPAKPGVKSPLIVIRTARTARGIEITVSDNGPGIAAENLAKIFEPLFTTKNFGTGLGLPAVEKIMEQHSGGLEVQSRPGQGAVFTAWWPIPASTVAAA